MEGEGHDSGRSYCIWATERNFIKEDIVFGERTPLFNVELARQCMPDRKIIKFMLGPEMLGWPHRRTRSFCIYLNQETTVWTGPHDAETRFLALFQRVCIIDGSELCVGSAADRFKYLLKKATNRGLHVPGDVDAATFDNNVVLSPGDRRRLEAYRKHAAAAAGPFFAEIGQEPDSGFGSSCGPAIPTLCRTGEIFAFHAGGFVLPEERFTCLGFPVHAKAKSKYSMPFDIKKLTSVEACQLTGNAIHLNVLLAFFLFVMAHVERRAPMESLPSAMAAPEEESNDAGETQCKRVKRL